MRHAKRISLFALVLTLFSVSAAHAQWVFLARRGLKVINSIASQLQNPSQSQVQGVDAPTVILDADAEKVYNVPSSSCGKTRICKSSGRTMRSGRSRSPRGTSRHPGKSVA